MRRTWKQVGSLFLAFCMVFTMLPTMSFAETGDVDSGAPLGASGTITAFAPLDEDAANRTVETGTAEDELILPDTLTVTVTTGSAVAVATDSEAQEPEPQEITEETTVPVSGWTSDPAYSPEYDAEGNNTYIFTPTLELPEGLTLAKGVRAPVISVEIQPLAGMGIMPLSAGYDIIVQGGDGADGLAGGADGADNLQTNADPEWRNVEVTGGNGGTGIPNGVAGGRGGDANLELSASAITGSISVVSGDGGDSNPSTNSTFGMGGTAMLNLTAPIVTVSGGILVKNGADGDTGVFCGESYLSVLDTLRTPSITIEDTVGGSSWLSINTLDVSEDTDITVNSVDYRFICDISTVRIADGKTLTINNAYGPLSIETINFTGSGTGRVVIADVANLTMGSMNFFHKAEYDIPESVVGTPIASIDVSAGVISAFLDTTPYSYSAVGLPAGIGIDPHTGVISGVPTTAGAAGTATITVTDKDSTSKSITINYGAIMTGGGTVVTITITGIVEPVGGASPVKTGATVPADANYAPREDIVWVDDENQTEPMADGAKFEAGKRYLCGVSVQLPFGHSFAPDVTATINGKTATVMLDGTKEAVVTYLFTAKDAADTPTITVTKHPQNITVTQGRINAALTAEAVASNGKPVSYQWFRFIGGIGNDNVEIIPGATSNTFPIPTDLTEGTYRYLCSFNTDGTDYTDSNTAIVTVNSPSSGVDNGDGSVNGGGGGGGGSGSGGSSGGGTPPVTVTSPNVDSTGAVNQTAITGEAVAALRGAASGGTAVVRTRNASSITPAVLLALANAAAGKNLVLHADTMSGNAVQGRIYVDPAKLADVKEPIKLGVYTESARTAATKSLFEKFFDNKVATVGFEQQGSLGARLEVAAKVDLTGMDIANLYLYSYDKATNTYRRIENPAYWVDKSGYLHFHTSLGGSIIITDKPLTPKK